MHLGTLEIYPVTEHLHLLAQPVRDVIAISTFSIDIGVAQIDPEFSDTAAFCEHYGVPISQTVNCVIVEAERGERKWLAACAVFGITRADVNGIIRRHLGARKASFAPMDAVLKQTGMEYGGISPIGLPSDWPLIIDNAVVLADLIVIGSGVRGSKLVLPGGVFASLPNALVLEGVGKER